MPANPGNLFHQNRGIGLAICQSLVASVSSPLVLYAVSRTGSDLGLRPVHAAVSVKYGPLNLLDSSSITALAARIEEEQSGCDVLINNAGIYHYVMNPTTEQRREMIDVNYRGTLLVNGTSFFFLLCTIRMDIDQREYRRCVKPFCRL